MHKTIKSISFVTLFVVSCLLLSGCATDHAIRLKERDKSKGIVVGTIFERAVFVPYGAGFTIQFSDGEKFFLSRLPKYNSKGDDITFEYTPPKVPKGAGRTFAMQLSPGRYKIIGWGLNYGRRYSMSAPPGKPIEFDVLANEAIYIGRLDANRFLEVASIHDAFDEDQKYFSELPQLKSISIINKSLSVKGWWLPDATGKETLRKYGNSCSQC